jgi:hypothetical protein
MVVVDVLLHLMVVMMAAGGAADLVGGAEVVAAVVRRMVVAVGREAAVRRRGVGFRWGAERERSVMGDIEALVRRRRRQRRRELVVDARMVVLVVGREVLKRVGVVVVPGPRGGSAAADTAGKLRVGVVMSVRVGVVVAGVGAPVARVVERRVRIHAGQIGEEMKLGSIDQVSGSGVCSRVGMRRIRKRRESRAAWEGGEGCGRGGSACCFCFACLSQPATASPACDAACGKESRPPEV